MLITTHVWSQTSEIQQCGLNNYPTLSLVEANYFNEVFLDRRGGFNFTNKAIAYFNGSDGTTRSKKSDYFGAIKNGMADKKNIHSWQAEGTQLLILTEEEKLTSGGFDVILVTWSKIRKEGRSRAQLVKRLKQ